MRIRDAVRKKPKLPSATFQEWARALLQIETLADAACYVQAPSFEQQNLLRSLVQETRRLREIFARQIKKELS